MGYEISQIIFELFGNDIPYGMKCGQNRLFNFKMTHEDINFLGLIKWLLIFCDEAITMGYYYALDDQSKSDRSTSVL